MAGDPAGGETPERLPGLAAHDEVEPVLVERRVESVPPGHEFGRMDRQDLGEGGGRAHTPVRARGRMRRSGWRLAGDDLSPGSAPEIGHREDVELLGPLRREGGLWSTGQTTGAVWDLIRRHGERAVLIQAPHARLSWVFNLNMAKSL